MVPVLPRTIQLRVQIKDKVFLFKFNWIESEPIVHELWEIHLLRRFLNRMWNLDRRFVTLRLYMLTSGCWCLSFAFLRYDCLLGTRLLVPELGQHGPLRLLAWALSRKSFSFGSCTRFCRHFCSNFTEYIL